MTASLETLQVESAIQDVDPEATAHMIMGVSCYTALWIASSENQRTTSRSATAAYCRPLHGLLRVDVETM
jgi:hypothetical protein